MQSYPGREIGKGFSRERDQQGVALQAGRVLEKLGRD